MMSAKLVALLALVGCGSPASSGSRAPDRSPPPTFTPPASIADCAPERLSVREVPVDLGEPNRSYTWLPNEYALQHHSYATESVVVLLVPRVELSQAVTSIRALRFDVVSSQWLPEARQDLVGHPALAPRYSEVSSGEIAAGYVVAWVDRLTKLKLGVVFSAHDGAFRPATGAELDSVPAFDGRARHPAYPADPDRATGVSVAVDYVGREATFSRGAAVLGTVRFPSMPGAYIGTFGTTGTGFFWDGGKQADRARLPLAEQRQTYLVALESGATCRVARDLPYPATAVFRRRAFIAFLNALRTEPERADCPPGAPCAAPEQAHFRGASLVVFADHGPP